jgi:cadmium resistance protein CadD (predicted permease)
VHSIIDVVVVSSLAFVGTMVDNFFAFAAQLALSERARYRRVSIAQGLGVAALIIVALSIGTLLRTVPLRWAGIFSIAPFAFALHAWRTRDQSVREKYRRGALTTFSVSVALGGDNIAVWIPLLRANSVAHEVVTVVVFALWEVLFVVGAQTIARHPRVVGFGEKYGHALLPWLYLGLGVLILVECKTFS